MFTTNLDVGIINSDVVELQRFLNKKGFLVSESGAGSQGNETNYFGEKTRQALIKYQLSKNITPAVGYFGPITRGFANNE